jgi:hypothetical protein
MGFLSGQLRRLACAFLLMILLGMMACKRPHTTSPHPVPVWLGPIVVTPAPGPDDQRLLVDRAVLTRQARLQLMQAHVFAGEAQEPAKNGGAVASVRITLAMEPVQAEGKAAVRAIVRLSVATRPQSVAPPHFTEDVEANAEMLYDPQARPEGGAVAQRLAERTLADLMAGYLARQKLWVADRATLHAALDAPGELRMEAIRVAAARKLVDEVPTLITLLSDEDENTRDAALGALVELRDRRAVRELTKAKSMRDRREMRKVIDALATLGGQEAEDYLSFVADAHEDEEIREQAKAALDHLRIHASGATRRP